VNNPVMHNYKKKSGGSGADGRVVEGRATLFRHHREVSRVRIPGRMGLPWMLCVVVSGIQMKSWAE
jgi:hypothetical protein